ncbi:MAG: acetate--CoA ligase [Bdellovibrio sp. CG10_big_fil_rev_8_21_14_0_10_47_8]|nr:MAG: acetate--CoA ligase [Bdellovibrio sp. CG10_big_fil_rev_8_21_14_0_10_47_8]
MEIAKYLELYEQSIRDPEKFWAEQAARIDWLKKWDQVKNVSFKSPVKIEWFSGAELNVAANCIDRHLAKRGDKIAILWEPDNPSEEVRKISYRELADEVGRMANVLKKHGVKKGDRVTIYMPMIPEAAFAMLACARVGAIHSVIFGGFSPDSIVDRIQGCDSNFVITADQGYRAGRKVNLKKNMDQALEKVDSVKKVLVIQRTKAPEITMKPGRDIWWHEERAQVSQSCAPEVMNAEDPLFILYTSGSTGKPKGVLHTSGGYLLYAALTHEVVFDLKEDDIFWCTADVGWVTGHSYIVYGPLANGATTVMFEGVPNYPSTSRFWEVVDKHKVTIFYTAPTAIRALMREGDAAVQKSSRKSLRLLGSVGEPINPEAWQWYHKVVGEERCQIVDTYWQTETGGILISPIPGAMKQKPGSATLPFFGVRPKVLSPEGQELSGECEGILVMANSWPGQMRTVYQDHQRFEETYFSAFKGYYFTGDGCKRDSDGYYWITGRIDDVLNVSGHRLGTAEIESALVAHAKVAEAAVVGYPHDIKGQGIYCFVTLKTGIAATDDLRKELIQWVSQEISPIAKPDLLQWAPSLPKTRSGKIMRRILRKIAENNPDQLGDTSTLADPSVVESLVSERLNK